MVQVVTYRSRLNLLLLWQLCLCVYRRLSYQKKTGGVTDNGSFNPLDQPKQTQDVLTQVTDYFNTQRNDGLSRSLPSAALVLVVKGQNMGLVVVLNDWDERKSDQDKVLLLSGRANQALSQIKEAFVYSFNIQQLLSWSSAGGFEFRLIDNANLGHEKPWKQETNYLEWAQEPQMLTGIVRPWHGQEDTSQYRLYIDLRKAQAQGVAVSDITNIRYDVWW